MAPAPPYRKDLYFQEQNRARRESLRSEVQSAATRLSQQEQIKGALATNDDLAQRIFALGFNGDSARVFDLLPLVHVAWADGSVQRKERELIFAILEERGIEPGSDASLLMEALLENRPSETFLGESLAILRLLLREDTGNGIVDLCLKVADASGGILGLGHKVAPEERALIEQVAQALGSEAERRFRDGF